MRVVTGYILSTGYIHKFLTLFSVNVQYDD